MGRKLPEGGLSLYIEKSKQFTRNAKLILISSLFFGLAMGVFRFLFNFYILSLGPTYNEAFIGTLQTAASLTAMAIALPAAYFSERFSQKNLMIGSALLTGLSFIGMVVFPLKLTLIAFRMIAQFAMVMRQVAIAPFLMQNTTKDERQWVFSFNFGLLTTASFLGNLIGGNLPTWLGNLVGAAPTDTLAYQLALGSMMLVIVLGVAPLSMLTAKERDVDQEIELPWKMLGRYGWDLTKFFVPQLIIGLGAGLMQPFMNIYFRNVYEKPDPKVAFVFSLGVLAMAIAQFLGPWLADKAGKIKAVVWTQGLSVPFLMTLGIGAFMVSNGIGTIELWFTLASFAFIFRLALMNMSNPVYQTFVLEHVPEDAQSLAMSLNLLSFQFGWAVMPQISGQLQVNFGDIGFVGVFGGVSLFYISAIIIEYFMFIRGDAGQTPALSEAKAVAGDK